MNAIKDFTLHSLILYRGGSVYFIKIEGFREMYVKRRFDANFDVNIAIKSLYVVIGKS